MEIFARNDKMKMHLKQIVIDAIKMVIFRICNLISPTPPTFLSAWLMNCRAWSTSFFATSKDDDEEEEGNTAVVETEVARSCRRDVLEEVEVEEEGRKGVEEENEVVSVEEVISVAQ